LPAKRISKFQLTKDNGLLRLGTMSISAGAVQAAVDMGAMNLGQPRKEEIHQPAEN
jgi:hypothetical protein